MGSRKTRKATAGAAKRAKSRRRTYNSAKVSSEASVTLWTEALFAAELVLLHASPVFYGLGLPRGDGSGVILIPGFLGTDAYLMELHAWLARLGYRPYFSGIGLNADCPNLLIQRRLNQTVEKALAQTGRKIHLIGHSLGGILARSAAAQRPRAVASVITLSAPFRGLVMHRAILRAAETVRKQIIAERGRGVLPGCYTGQCTCDFLASLQRRMPKSIRETAIYTRQDGLVDWQCCITKHPEYNFEVVGTHIGMAFNPSAYAIIAERLAQAQCD